MGSVFELLRQQQAEDEAIASSRRWRPSPFQLRSEYINPMIGLDPETFGAGIRLMMAMWRSVDGTIPDEDRYIARVVRCTPARWRARLRPVLRDHFRVAGGKWMHVVIADHRAKAEAAAVSRARAIARARSAIGKVVDHA
jgi:uncharacterized protein YdaU (DUF1376 family)